MCETPQAAVEVAHNQEREVSAIVNTAAKATDDLSVKAETTKADDDLSANGGAKEESPLAASEKNRIQVSDNKKPLFFYFNLQRKVYALDVIGEIPEKLC